MKGLDSQGLVKAKAWSLQPPLAELVVEADETLFKNILHIKQRASSTVAGQNAINLQPSLKKTWPGASTPYKRLSKCSMEKSKGEVFTAFFSGIQGKEKFIIAVISSAN